MCQAVGVTGIGRKAGSALNFACSLLPSAEVLIYSWIYVTEQAVRLWSALAHSEHTESPASGCAPRSMLAGVKSRDLKALRLSSWECPAGRSQPLAS